MATQRDLDDFQKAQQGILTGTNSGYYDQAKFNKEQAERNHKAAIERARQKELRKAERERERAASKRGTPAERRPSAKVRPAARSTGKADNFAILMGFLVGSGVVYFFVRSAAVMEWWGWVLAFLIPYAVMHHLVTTHRGFRNFLKWSIALSVVIGFIAMGQSS